MVQTLFFIPIWDSESHLLSCKKKLHIQRINLEPRFPGRLLRVYTWEYAQPITQAPFRNALVFFNIKMDHPSLKWGSIANSFHFPFYKALKLPRPPRKLPENSPTRHGKDVPEETPPEEEQNQATNNEQRTTSTANNQQPTTNNQQPTTDCPAWKHIAPTSPGSSPPPVALKLPPRLWRLLDQFWCRSWPRHSPNSPGLQEHPRNQGRCDSRRGGDRAPPIGQRFGDVTSSIIGHHTSLCFLLEVFCLYGQRAKVKEFTPRESRGVNSLTFARCPYKQNTSRRKQRLVCWSSSMRPESFHVDNHFASKNSQGDFQGWEATRRKLQNTSYDSNG